MAVYRYPGEFRVGVLNAPVQEVAVAGVQQVEPKFQLLVLLHGHQCFELAGQRVELDARTRAAAVFMCIARPTTLRFLLNRGHPLTKIALAMPVDWLAQVGRESKALRDLATDVSWRRWRPGSRMTGLAAALVAETAELPRMALGLELLETALADIGRGKARRDAEAEIDAVRRYVRRHAGSAPGAAEVARACGLGLRSLERLVARVEGRPLGAFLRDLRLDAASEALRQGGTSVAEAAWIAGYSSPANFATALRRVRGISPRDLRREG